MSEKRDLTHIQRLSYCEVLSQVEFVVSNETTRKNHRKLDHVKGIEKEYTETIKTYWIWLTKPPKS